MHVGRHSRVRTSHVSLSLCLHAYSQSSSERVTYLTSSTGFSFFHCSSKLMDLAHGSVAASVLSASLIPLPWVLGRMHADRIVGELRQVIIGRRRLGVVAPR